MVFKSDRSFSSRDAECFLAYVKVAISFARMLSILAWLWKAKSFYFTEITVAVPLYPHLSKHHFQTLQKVIITTANVDLPSKVCMIVKLLSL